MAYEINVHVNKNGKLELDVDPFEISVFRESRRVKLLFEVDAEIDSTYHYLKFTHARATYLYRVHSNVFEIPKAITAYEGAWEMSFIACDEVANSDSTITAEYIYASEPVVATVLRGNLGEIHTSEEFVLLSQLVEGRFDHFEIPEGCTYITSYFLSQASNEFTVTVPSTITTIKDHAFYESGCTHIEFEPGSQLATLEANALYRIPNLDDINFPSSLSSWGNYNLGGCGCEYVTFGANSNLRQLTSYAFWNIPNLKKLYLPDRLQSFTGGTAVIKSCPLLNEVWFPNTINVAIPQSSIQDCPLLTKISLQSNFNVSCNFGNCTSLTRESVVQMFRNLKDLSGGATKVITLHQTVLDLLTSEEMDIALNKNWSIGSVDPSNVLSGKTFIYTNSTTEIVLSFTENSRSGHMFYNGNDVGFQFDYDSSSTFTIVVDAGYNPESWGAYRPVPAGQNWNQDCSITFSSGNPSSVKIKMYNANNTGTNRTFNLEVVGG